MKIIDQWKTEDFEHRVTDEDGMLRYEFRKDETFDWYASERPIDDDVMARFVVIATRLKELEEKE